MNIVFNIYLCVVIFITGFLFGFYIKLFESAEEKKKYWLNCLCYSFARAIFLPFIVIYNLLFHCGENKIYCKNCKYKKDKRCSLKGVFVSENKEKSCKNFERIKND